MKLENRLSLFLGHCYQILFKTKLMEYENLKIFLRTQLNEISLFFLCTILVGYCHKNSDVPVKVVRITSLLKMVAE